MINASFPTPELGWAVGITGDIYYMWGIIANTTDGGETWSLQECPTDQWPLEVFFVNSEIGWVTAYSGVILKTNTGGLLAVEQDKIKNKPSNFFLSQNYPNPFNPSTKINFSIPQTRFVTLKIYDIIGKEISTLINEEKPAGNYEVEFNGSNLSSGVYFYKIKAGSFINTKKFVLIK